MPAAADLTWHLTFASYNKPDDLSYSALSLFHSSLPLIQVDRGLGSKEECMAQRVRRTNEDLWRWEEALERALRHELDDWLTLFLSHRTANMNSSP